MILSLEMDATLGRTKAAISLRVRRLALSSLNKFWLEGALRGGLVALIRSNCFVDLSTGVASVLLITAGAVVAADVTEAIVAVLLLPCCCGVAAAFGDPMTACVLLLGGAHFIVIYMHRISHVKSHIHDEVLPDAS